MKSMHELADKEWLTQCLWTGAIRSHGAAAAALVGSPEEVAAAILEYSNAGVTQFILSGWPKLEEMIFFGRHVIPLVRSKEPLAANMFAGHQTA
jgi:alkanesulfonate monooxygenase